MTILPNFPFKDQLFQIDLDHLPDINARMECVPTCLAAGLQYLTGREYEGEELLHAVYGKDYIGGTMARSFIDYCQNQGVRLTSYTGDLVALIHQELAKGHPVIGTIPSSYDPPADKMNPGPSHCIIFYEDQPGSLTAMNPWKAFAQSGLDQWWTARLCFNEVWSMSRFVVQGVPQGWMDDGETLTAPNGISIRAGFRQYVLTHQWNKDNWPLEQEHGEVNLELGNPLVGGGTMQAFRWTVLEWTASRGVFEMWTGQEIIALKKYIQTMRKV